MLPFVVPTYFYGKTGLIAVFIIVSILTGVTAAFSILGASCVFVHDVLEVYVRVSSNGLFSHQRKTFSRIEK